MTRPLIPGVVAAMMLTTPAFAGPGHGHGHAHGRAVVVRPYGAVVVAPAYRPYYYRPYYTFRPHVSIGFGIWAGYPVPYPVYAAPYPYSYGYPAPYGYPPPPPYPSAYPTQPYPQQGYPPQGYPQQSYPQQSYPQQSYPQQSYPSQSSQPYPSQSYAQPRATSSSASGGVSFEMTPSNASVFVDGRYVGSAQDFGPQMRPLTLSAGRHRVEIQAGGYDSMAFDTTVTAGQVTPYRGTLQQR